MGRAWTLGDNVNTDAITPEHYKIQGREVYVAHALEPVRPEFADEVEPGDVVVAGRNFGAGSSRESAPIALLENGVGAVVAASFARIFYRNAINIGLPVYTSPEASEGIEDGDEVEVDPDGGTVRNVTRGESYDAEDHPEFVQEIIRHGGLAGYRETLD